MRIATTSGFIARLFAFTAAAWCGGCSLLFHADAPQCATSSDCTARGFVNTLCQAGTCTPQSSMAEAGAETGTDAQGDTGDADAGTPCSSYSDCVNAGFGNPEYPQVACDIDTETCVQLTSAECPLVTGDYTETMHVHPIFVGAFAVIPPANQTSDPSYQNYDLAISEFTSNSGIPVGGGSSFRMPVAVVCNVAADTDTAMQDLQAAHVTSVVAALDSATLATTFSTYGFNTKANLFFVNPFGADSNLTALARGNQLWDLLGNPPDLVSAYVAIMPRIESYIRNNAPWSLGPLVGGDAGASTQLRVAMVTGDATVTNELSSAVNLSTISWNNGQSSPLVDNGTTSPTFRAYSITMSSLNGQTPDSPEYSTMFSNLVTELQSFQPHVIISFGSEEFLYLLGQLEAVGPNTLPFYLVGPYNADSPTLVEDIGPESTASPLLKRVAGINFASPTNSSLAAYQTRFNARYSTPEGGPPNDNESNYYDAMYFAVDSLAGAGKTPPLSGTAVGSGMLNLTAAAGTSCPMGPGMTGMTCVFNALDTPPNTVNLLGTLGPAIFNPTTGARVSTGDVYCMLPVTGQAATYDYDVLRLTPSPDGGAEIWEGTFPCYSGF
jgi:hypothetical protein